MLHDSTRFQLKCQQPWLALISADARPQGRRSLAAQRFAKSSGSELWTLFLAYDVGSFVYGGFSYRMRRITNLIAYITLISQHR